MQWWIIVRKEFLDLFRDRKTWMTTVLIPILLIPSLFLIMGNVFSRTNEEASKNIPIVIDDPTGSVKKWIGENPAFKIQPNVENIEKTVKQGNIRIGLRVDPNYKQKMESLQPVSIEVLYDPSDNRSQISAGILQSYLTVLNQRLLGERLGKLGLQQQVITPLEVKEINLATKEQMAGGFLAFLIPLMLLMSVASGGMPAATDLVAGEKERGTLEALLTTPAGTRSVLIGKLIVVSVMGCISAIASLLAFTVTMKTKAFQTLSNPGGTQSGAGGGTVDLGFLNGSNVLFILLIMFLLAVMFAGIQLALSTLAKSFKEASTYMSPIVIIAMIPAYLLMQTGVKDLTTSYFVLPIFNVIAIFKEFIFGVFDMAHIGMVIGSTLVYVFMAIGFAAYLFRKESLIFKE